MNSYKDLIVYKKSYDTAIQMYREMRKLPKEETFGLISQIKRAATSIPLNIAEGYGKGVQGKELVRFLTMARGSCAEMEVLISFCKDLNYLIAEEAVKYENQYEEIGKMLTGLIKSVN